MDEEGLSLAGVTEDMVRISVGLETLDDIVWDLDRAIRAATA
jgi:O-acetylhomoserine (thiol)-lyase